MYLPVALGRQPGVGGGGGQMSSWLSPWQHCDGTDWKEQGCSRFLNAFFKKQKIKEIKNNSNGR